MKHPIHISKRLALVLVAAAAVAIAAGLLESGRSHGQAANANAPPQAAAKPNAETALDLSPSQLNSIKIEPVGSHLFPVEKEAVGNIDYDEDLSVQVFPAYQGTIIQALGELGAEVQKDQPLYTIKSPDLIQAESTLIGAAATFVLTNKELARVQGLGGIAEREKEQPLYTIKSPDLIQAESTLIGAAATFVLTNKELIRVQGLGGVAEREREQATSDQQTAEGALKAARDAVRVFGKTDAEIDQMIASRKIDPALVVRSPIPGKITAKNAQPGFLVQPGNLPAPYSVADVSIKWMLANVIESDVPQFHLGQPVQVRVMSYPDRVFRGKVSKIYETVDPNTHRVTIRSEIADPKDELHPGMLANFVIRVHDPVESIDIPANGVVREADGTMTAWVTTDRHRFVLRIIRTGLRQDGQVQILAGLQRGELVVADGAVFLSNMLEAPPSD